MTHSACSKSLKLAHLKVLIVQKRTILFSTTYTALGFNFLRQLPSVQKDWNQFEFTTDSNHPDLFGCVVYDDAPERLNLTIPRSHTLLITGEPPTLRTYRPRFTHQFGAVRTSHADLRHPNKTLDHEGLPWYYGLHRSDCHGSTLNFDALEALPFPEKPRKLSVIASNKTTTEDHRERLRFVERLKIEFPGQIDVFGRGIRDMSDKADAIYPYEYHIVLENDHSDYYVSEKLTDAYLGWAYPFYFGSKNADWLLPNGAFTRIDIYNPDAAVAEIKQAIANQAAAKSREIMEYSRTKILEELNLLSIIQRHFLKLPDASRKTTRCTIHPKRFAVKQILSGLKRQFEML